MLNRLESKLQALLGVKAVERLVGGANAARAGAGESTRHKVPGLGSVVTENANGKAVGFGNGNGKAVGFE